ncbi:spore coat polysaccharide biosynthesis glycosyltransferase ExoK [Corallococcus macrosporus]|uniref:Glycosyl transferase family 1 n=1 Tax=Corallococcus macrosporus DSM 14697 TaxID=1189310 RepID=A0A250JV44_9BACT|nr:spore coat polysaccharide biosynthesis glycosyltransferase ExoK [Corallococcus macrosporus]ATB47367.1 glycosyl transferase family 1 [Corallococcus macrosporus DSM 14697]
MRREEARMGQEPLRLVQFTRSFHIGGTEVQVLELLRGLPASYRLQVSVLDDSGPLIGAVWKLGHAPAAFPLKGSVVQPNTAYQVYRMARWLRANRVELVHVHDFYSTMVAVPAAKLAGTKVIVGRLDLAHWQGRARRAVQSQLCRMADHVVGNAEAIRHQLITEEGLPPSRVSVIHNGLDLPRFEARRREGLRGPLPDTGDAPVVVHVANMNHPVKRQEDLLLALAQLRHAGLRLHAFLVGDGPRRPGLEKLAGELGVSDTVHFLRHRTDVPAIYARATFGVLCSTAEGMSNAVMEGMAAGLPMVVTRVGGNTDLVRDGERGLVVDPERPAQLAQAFRQLLSNPEKAREMGQAARDFVARELSLEKMVRRHDALYQRIARGTDA